MTATLPEWYNAPKPKWWHRCKVYSSGNVDGLFVGRCACGAVQLDGWIWIERNSRRDSS